MLVLTHPTYWTLKLLLQWLIKQGKPQLALEVARIFLNLYNVRAVYAAYR